MTAEPSDGPLGAVARAHIRHEVSLDAVTTALTFVADRADHVERVIRPALERGEWVVCDRYLLSTSPIRVQKCGQAVGAGGSAGIPAPDLTVYLDVPDRQRAERMSSRAGADRYEGAELQTALGRAYAESIDLLRSRGIESPRSTERAIRP